MIDAGGAVVHEVGIGPLADEVFEFFTDAERLVRWIGFSASLTPRGGR